MSDLGKLAVMIGCTFVVFHLPAVMTPQKTRSWLKSFPRNKPMGFCLSAIAVALAAYLLHGSVLVATMPSIKPLVVVLAPVAYVLIVIFLGELLAPRALGGLLLIAPMFLLDTARWHSSPWRLVLTVLAYIWVIQGSALMLSPFLFRKTAEFLSRSDTRLRIAGCLGAAAGIGLLLLSLLEY